MKYWFVRNLTSNPKKKKQKSRINVNYFCNKLKRYFAEHPESLSEFTNTWTNENDN